MTIAAVTGLTFLLLKGAPPPASAARLLLDPEEIDGRAGRREELHVTVDEGNVVPATVPGVLVPFRLERALPGGIGPEVGLVRGAAVRVSNATDAEGVARL